MKELSAMKTDRVLATVDRITKLLLTFFVAGVFIHISPYLLELIDPPSTKPVATAQASSAEEEEELQVLDAAVSDRCWTKLQKAGYTGRPGDGQEAFYVAYSDLSTICGKTVAAKVAKKQDKPAAGSQTAEDGSQVNPNFYDRTDYNRNGVADQDENAPAAGSRTAEDGSKVKPGFYDRTDYNRNGVADQDEGFPTNPRPEDVKAGRK
jgi:hypothetical protein